MNELRNASAEAEAEAQKVEETAWDTQRRKNREKMRESRQQCAREGQPEPLSEDELQECLADHSKTKTIRGPEWVIALEALGDFPAGWAYRTIPRSYRAEYREKRGRDIPIASANASANWSAASKKADRSHAWQHSLETRKGKPGKPLTAEHKANIKIAHLERDVDRDIPLWPIVKQALRGLTTAESENKLDGWQADIWRVCRDVGLSGWPGALLHGEVVTRQHVLQFCADTGLFEKDAASFVGFGYRAFTNLIGSKPDRALSSKHPKDKKGSPHIGRRLAASYRLVGRVFCCHRDRRVPRHGRIRDFLQSEIRDIPKKHALLTMAFTRLGQALRLPEVQAHPDPIMNWICKQTRIEGVQAQVSGTTELPMRTLVYFGIHFERLLKDKPELIAPEKFGPGALATALLAQEYGAAPGRIDAVREGQITPLDARQLSQRIMETPRLPRLLMAKRRGPKGGPFEDTEAFDCGQKVEKAMLEMESVMRAKAALPRRRRSNPSTCAEDLRRQGYSAEQSNAASLGHNTERAAKWLVSLCSNTRWTYDTVASYYRTYHRRRPDSLVKKSVR